MKLSETILSILWRLLGNIYLFLTPSKTDGRISSQQGTPTTSNLTYWEVSQQTKVQTLLASLVVDIGRNSALQRGVGRGGGGGGGGGRFLTNSTYQLFETPKNQIPSDTLNCLFPSNNFTFQGHIIFSMSPSQRKSA